MPTLARMKYAGPDKRPRYPPRRKLPVVAQWRLPSMATGDRWEQSVEIGVLPNGYYHIAVEISTRAPPESRDAYVIDDAYAQAWMFVTDGGGLLTRAFDESIFPARIAPLPGPFRPRFPGRAMGAMQTNAATGYNSGGQGKVHVEVVYYENGSKRPATGSYITATTVSDEGGDDHGVATESFSVPSSGMVAFSCPGPGYMLTGYVILPSNGRVASGSFNGYWDAYHSECGETIQVVGTRHTYLPWKHLREVIPRIETRLGTSRSRVWWTVDLSAKSSSYHPGSDRITFGPTYHSKWTAAHEYGHALHEETLGGTWGAESICYNPDERTAWGETGYKCALLEGFADYVGNVGDPDDLTRVGDLEHPDPTPGGIPGRIEGSVAALFHDLLDWESDGNDRTAYSPTYVLTVFGTCRIQTWAFLWQDRDDVADFVWCLERDVDGDVHDESFPGLGAPRDVSEGATEPTNWNRHAIRQTWLQNVGG